MTQQVRKPRPDQEARPAGINTTDTKITVWRAEALRVLGVLSRTGVPFHAEDVLALVGFPPDPHQLGACFAAAQRQRVIQVADAAVVDGRLLRVWRGAS